MARWAALGPTNPAPFVNPTTFGRNNGRIDALAIDPNDQDTIWAGSAAGLWKGSLSPPGGMGAWRPVSDGYSFWGISNIAICPTVLGRMYVVAGDWVNAGHGFPTGDLFPRAILRSDDNGLTWIGTVDPTSPDMGEIYRIALAPDANCDVLYAATATGVWKTVDAATGMHWLLSLQAPIDLDFFDVKVQANALGTHVYASTRETNCGGPCVRGQIWNGVSTGATDAWGIAPAYNHFLSCDSQGTNCTDPGTAGIVLAVSPANDMWVYALMAGPVCPNGYKAPEILRWNWNDPIPSWRMLSPNPPSGSFCTRRFRLSSG